MNSFVIGFETVEEWKVPHKNVFKALDELFLAIYTMEFLMKLYAEPRGYWKSSYNRFDFSILALSYVQVIMDELNVGDKILTPLRLLRGLWESPWQLDWGEGKFTHKWLAQLSQLIQTRTKLPRPGLQPCSVKLSERIIWQPVLPKFFFQILSNPDKHITFPYIIQQTGNAITHTDQVKVILIQYQILITNL